MSQLCFKCEVSHNISPKPLSLASSMSFFKSKFETNFELECQETVQHFDPVLFPPIKIVFLAIFNNLISCPHSYPISKFDSVFKKFL